MPKSIVPKRKKRRPLNPYEKARLSLPSPLEPSVLSQSPPETDLNQSAPADLYYLNDLSGEFEEAPNLNQSASPHLYDVNNLCSEIEEAPNRLADSQSETTGSSDFEDFESSDEEYLPYFNQHSWVSVFCGFFRVDIAHLIVGLEEFLKCPECNHRIDLQRNSSHTLKIGLFATFRWRCSNYCIICFCSE